MGTLTDEGVALTSIQPPKTGCETGRQNYHLLSLSRPAFSHEVKEDSGVVFKGLQKISLLDYPRKLAAIIFVGGCNFRCPFCYNRDLVLNPESSPSIREGEILEYLEARREWLDGVVVTGGEPTIYSSLPSFLEKVKKLGYSIKLDTNGSNSRMLAELFKKNLVDYVALDVKAPLDKDDYQRVIRTSSDEVLKEVENSISLLKDSNGVDYEFRTTVVPNLLTKEDILLIAERIKGAKRYYLQQFKPTDSHVDESYSIVRPYPLQTLQEIQMRIASNFQVCKVRGTAINFRIDSPRGSNSLNITFTDLSPQKWLKGKDEGQHGGG